MLLIDFPKIILPIFFANPWIELLNQSDYMVIFLPHLHFSLYHFKSMCILFTQTSIYFCSYQSQANLNIN